MSFEADHDKKSFSFDGLRRYEGQQPDKADRYDACVYTFYPSDFILDTEIISVSFPQLENVEVYLTTGKSRFGKKTADIGKVTKAGKSLYNATAAEKLFVTVLPKKNAETTNFEIEYQIVAAPDTPEETCEFNLDFFKCFYDKHFTGPDGFRTLIVFGSCLACLLFLLIACCCICCRQCRKKKSKDGEIGDISKVHALDGSLKKDPLDPIHQAEMVLESLSERGSGPENYMIENTIEMENSFTKLKGSKLS